MTSACAVTQVKLDFQQTFENEQEAFTNNAKSIDGKRILFISDNQETIITTEPIIELSRWSEIKFNTAHRRPAVDEFSIDVMDYIAESEPHDLIISPGDILNNSCKWEFDQAAEFFDATGSPWFVAPGNHDGFYSGISSPTAISKGLLTLGNVPFDEREGWAKTCVDLSVTEAGVEKGGFENYQQFEKSVVDKVAYIGYYLKAIGILDLIEAQPELVKTVVQPGTYKGYEEYAVQCIDFKAATGGLYRQYMSDICWTQHKDNDDYFNNFHPEADKDERWDEMKPWRNFLVQKLEFESSDILIVDSTSYSKGVALADSGKIILAGKEGASGFGHISDMQWQAIGSMLSDDRELIVVAHHPMRDFDPDSFARIEALYEKHNAVHLITGDTHNGYDASVKPRGRSGGFIVNESNVGSTKDAPIEYALGGYSQGQFLLKRFSLTPMRIVQSDGSEGPFKRSITPKSDKNYATVKRSLWDEACTDAFGAYVPNANRAPLTTEDISRGDDPFLTGEFVSPFAGLEVKQVKNAFSYVKNPGLYSKNLYIYKLDRLIWLSEIYNKLYAYADHPKSDEIVQLENEIAADLRDAKENYKDWLNDKKTRPFYMTMVKLSQLIRLYQENTPTDEPAQLFKVCSAIYEAESEGGAIYE